MRVVIRTIIRIVLCGAALYADRKPEDMSVYSILPLEAEGEIINRGILSAFRDYEDEKSAISVSYKALDGGKSTVKASKLIRGISDKYPVILNLFTRGHVPDLVKDLFDEPRVLFFAPVDNSDRWYSAQFFHIIHAQPPIKDEVEVLLEHALEKLEAHYVAVFYENSDYGRSGRDTVKEKIKQYKAQNRDVDMVGEGSYPINSLRIGKAVKSITASQPDVVICISRRHATYNFVNKMVDSGFFTTHYLGISYLLPIQHYLYRSQGIRFGAVSPVPNLYDTSIPIIHDYHKSLKRHFPIAVPNYLSLRGYINARLLLHVIANTSAPYSLQSVRAAIRSLKHLEFGGLYIHFDESTHNLMHDLWLSESHGRSMIQYRNGRKLFPPHKKKGNTSLWQSVRGIV